MRIASCIALVLMSAWPWVASSQEMVVVRPQVIDDVLVNPGIGFMTFQRFNGDTLNEGKKWTEGYPDRISRVRRQPREREPPDDVVGVLPRLLEVC